MTTTFITGKATFTPEGLRCEGTRLSQPEFPCNKLLAKTNRLGQLSGQFKCPRCKQTIEIEVRST